MAFFITLGLASCVSTSERRKLFQRTGEAWLIDGLSLLIQGLVVPMLQVGLTFFLLHRFFPTWQRSWKWGATAAFLLNFVVVDYLYFCCHRLLHTRRLWPWHRLHHSSPTLDMVATSRNSWLTSFFLPYFWANTFFAFMLDAPGAYMVGMAITAGLDLWRHSGFQLPPGSHIHRFLALAIITPNEHHWHHGREHSRAPQGINFGANLSLWDRWHGSYFSAAEAPKTFGVNESLVLSREFIFPRRAEGKNHVT
jgi:sterol desaturase/sphingolipid hydroxylase (fatty acid hydroxylase superfamily)